ncbi:MAG: hypothetical protein M3Z85_03810, partial [Acidobacteriota bacterium]|nr:hypothetical protein [Acidobacteriota bacterium]
SGAIFLRAFDVVVTSLFTFVVALRISTVAPDTGAFCGSVTNPEIEPSSNCAHAEAHVNKQTDTNFITGFITDVRP